MRPSPQRPIARVCSDLCAPRFPPPCSWLVLPTRSHPSSPTSPGAQFPSAARLPLASRPAPPRGSPAPPTQLPPAPAHSGSRPPGHGRQSDLQGAQCGQGLRKAEQFGRERIHESDHRGVRWYGTRIRHATRASAPPESVCGAACPGCPWQPSCSRVFAFASVCGLKIILLILSGR